MSQNSGKLLDNQLDLLRSQVQQTKEVQAIDLVLNTLDHEVASLQRTSKIFQDTGSSTMAICDSIRAETLIEFRKRVEQIREAIIAQYIPQQKETNS